MKNGPCPIDVPAARETSYSENATAEVNTLHIILLASSKLTLRSGICSGPHFCCAVGGVVMVVVVVPVGDGGCGGCLG